MGNLAYALITAAKNEETYIPQTLESVVKQTQLPRIWIIVSDGSTDRTDDLVTDFARNHRFIRLLRLDNQAMRSFSSKVFAANAGYDAIRHIEFDFVGFLDADITFHTGYYQELLAKFLANPRVGVAGGGVLERRSGRFQRRFGYTEDDVPGAIQFFRRRCYEDIGGQLTPLVYGGEDFVANATARMKGWEVRSFSDLHVFHHRTTGSAGTTSWSRLIRAGKHDYFVGYHALFELGKCIRRAAEPPFVIASFMRLCGYVFSWLANQRRILPDEFVRYLRQEQLGRIRRRMRVPKRGIPIPARTPHD